ncbi:MAG: hypothetical protein GF400_04985 [Candidatus Eisenbacteria bacterium]|nr:hypothetical protein [Candidatus Eisenbacteria bacterium]
MKRRLAVLAMSIALLGANARAQLGVEMSGGIDVWLDWVTEDDGTNEYKTHDQDLDMALKFKYAPSETIAMKAKLDVEDTATDGDLLEEAYITWSNVGSPASPLSITFGRKELEFGQDKYLWETELNTHLWGEIDNRLALEFGVKAGDRAKVYLTNWQDTTDTYTTGSGDEEPRDGFLFQSYALKGEVALARGLDLNLSYANIHDEGDTGAGETQDQGRLSAGVVYSDEQLGLTAFFEYLMVTGSRALTGTDEYGFTGPNLDGNDGGVMQIGARYAFGLEKKMEVGLFYETAAFDTGGTDTVDRSAVVLGFGYSPHKRNTILIEYVSESDDLGDIDRSTITTGVTCKF